MTKSTSRVIESIIVSLIGNMQEYKNTVIDVCAGYREAIIDLEKKAAEKYAPDRKPKDIVQLYDPVESKKVREEEAAEDAVLAKLRKDYIENRKESLKPVIVEKIRTAQKVFQESAAEAAKLILESLESAAKAQPSNAFLNYARTYKEFGISPSFMELEGMISLSENHPLGIRVIEKILSESNSPYTLYQIEDQDGNKFRCRTLEDMEKELKLIESLATDSVFCAPIDYVPELGDCFYGTPVYSDPSDAEKAIAMQAGNFDSNSILMYGGAFENDMQKLEEMITNWTAETHCTQDHVLDIGLPEV